jgi:hypothetical protein
MPTYAIFTYRDDAPDAITKGIRHHSAGKVMVP